MDYFWVKGISVEGETTPTMGPLSSVEASAHALDYLFLNLVMSGGAYFVVQAPDKTKANQLLQQEIAKKLPVDIPIQTV